MKMKSLLLGSAAGLVAVAGAQAADLPVKAKPAQYVKICALYGAGFYYIPGTDICLKVGGWVRAEYGYPYGSSMTTGPWTSSYSRIDGNDYNQRTRAYATFDARQQTAYGVLRSYLAVGTSADQDGSSTFNANRAFIQFAGFTFGTAASFYDFYSAAAVAYNAAFTHASDTGDPGWKVLAYTARFGSGVSATLSAEYPRDARVVSDSTIVQSNFGNSTLLNSNNDKVRYPDIVGNIRVDGPWGALQVMGALHDASSGYYTPANWNTGHPGDKMGWAAGVGLRLNAPMFGPGDYFQGQFNYTVGAVRYAAFTAGGAYNPTRYSGNTVGWGFFTDGVYGGSGGVELTTAWGFNLSYEHFWTPALRTSLYGSYLKVNYNSNATSLISARCAATISVTSCDPDWAFWTIGSRTAWKPVKDLEMGLDVIYMKLKSMTTNTGTATLAAIGGSGIPAATYTVKDQDHWLFRFRVHRDFVP